MEGVSRALLAQITRHRVASFSVASQRYINSNNMDFSIPEAIENNVNTARIFGDCMQTITSAYRDIHAYLMSEKLREKYAKFITHDGLNIAFQNNAKYFYLALDSKMEAMHTDPNATEEDQKLYKEFKKDRSAAEKFANENARSVLPNAAQTNLTVTMNARELLHFFSLRCCNRAQDEIRELASQMLVLCQQVAPNIFDNAGAPCVSGKCPEGKMSCGHPQKAEV